MMSKYNLSALTSWLKKRSLRAAIFALVIAPMMASASGAHGQLPMWESLGGAIQDTPSVVKNADGRLEVFVHGTDNALWHKWQVAPNSGWSSNWVSLGGEFKGAPAAAVNADGRLEVFVPWTDGTLRHKWQVTPGGGWSN